jgi:CCR4-NOT transcription complex subunit 1
LFKVTENDFRQMIGEAVESSINEILPPVVTRSVTIALITTRELVLKDFAFDGDLEKLSSAIDNIMQNLAGALALVTCRDPLRMSLNENLVRALQQGCFNCGATNGLVKGDDLRARDSSEATEV